jgi:hypothetical protein
MSGEDAWRIRFFTAFRMTKTGITYVTSLLSGVTIGDRGVSIESISLNLISMHFEISAPILYWNKVL